MENKKLNEKKKNIHTYNKLKKIFINHPYINKYTLNGVVKANIHTYSKYFLGLPLKRLYQNPVDISNLEEKHKKEKTERNVIFFEHSST